MFLFYFNSLTPYPYSISHRLGVIHFCFRQADGRLSRDRLVETILSCKNMTNAYQLPLIEILVTTTDQTAPFDCACANNTYISASRNVPGIIQRADFWPGSASSNRRSRCWSRTRWKKSNRNDNNESLNGNVEAVQYNTVVICSNKSKPFPAKTHCDLEFEIIYSQVGAEINGMLSHYNKLNFYFKVVNLVTL